MSKNTMGVFFLYFPILPIIPHAATLLYKLPHILHNSTQHTSNRRHKMPASKDPSTYEPCYHMLFEALSNIAFEAPFYDIQRKDTKAAMNFRARWYSFLRAKEFFAYSHRKTSRDETTLYEAQEFESAITRAKRFKAIIINENTVRFEDRTLGEDKLIEDLMNLNFKLQQDKTDRQQRLNAVEHELVQQRDDIYANFTIPQNPATPAGQTLDPKPGVDITVIVRNTVDRLRHGKIPKLSLPFSPEEQTTFLTLLQNEENLPEFTIVQTDHSLTIHRIENV